MAQGQSAHAEWDRLRNVAFRAPWLSAERERELIEQAQAGDGAAMRELCESHLRLVVQIAARFLRPGVQPEDLVGEGSIGLIEAIRRFDLAQKTRLSTYAAWWIRARIREYTYASRSVVSLPSTRGARIVRAQLASAELALSNELGRAPSRAELAEALNVSEVDVASVAVALSTHNLSLTDPVTDHRFEPRDDRLGPEDEYADRESQRLLEDSVKQALASLGERDRMIINAHFLTEETSLSGLGSSLGITRQRVSQIVQRVRKKLAKDLCCAAC